MISPYGPPKETFQAPPLHSDPKTSSPPQRGTTTTTTPNNSNSNDSNNKEKSHLCQDFFFLPVFVGVYLSRLVHSRAKRFTVSSAAGESWSKPNTLSIYGQRDAPIWLCVINLSSVRGKEPTCVSPGVSTVGEASAWRLAADQRSAAWRAIRAGLPLLHPQAPKAAEQCSDRFWPSLEERIMKKKKKNLVSTLLCSTWMVCGNIFYRLSDFFRFYS